MELEIFYENFVCLRNLWTGLNVCLRGKFSQRKEKKYHYQAPCLLTIFLSLCGPNIFKLQHNTDTVHQYKRLYLF